MFCRESDSKFFTRNRTDSFGFAKNDSVIVCRLFGLSSDTSGVESVRSKTSLFGRTSELLLGAECGLKIVV